MARRTTMGFTVVAGCVAVAACSTASVSDEPLGELTERLVAATGTAADRATDIELEPMSDAFDVQAAVINAAPSCTVAVVTSLANAARCDLSNANDDGDTLSGINVDNMDHGARLADFPTSISVGLGTYTFRDWLDVLRVLWAGADNTLGFAQGGSNGQTPQNRASRCGSAVRRALVSNWDNVVEDLTSGSACGRVPATLGAQPTSCEDPTTGVGLPLRHLFRPSDGDEVTGTFLSALGLAASAQQPFCNGTDLDDDDPIRVRCTTNQVAPSTSISDNAHQLNDETCGADQTTGLILPIQIPADLAALYPVVNCDTGEFAVRRPPAKWNNVQKCPDGTPYLFTGCLTPIGADDCRCVNAWTNRTAAAADLNPNIGGLQNDGRIWNRFFRGRGTRPNPCPVLAGTDFPNGPVLADARMRYRTQTTNGVSVPADRVCRFATVPEQIGCLSRAAECSIGFADPTALVDSALPYTAATLLEGPTCF